MNSDIGMVGMDFDLTLVDYPDGKAYVSPETLALFEDLISRGVEVGIVSGRYWWEMRDILEQAGLKWGQPFPSFFITRESYLFWLRDGKQLPDEAWNEARAADVKELTGELLRREFDWFNNMELAGLHAARWILWGDYGLEVHFSTMEDADRMRRLLADWSADMPLARTHRNRFMAHVVLATSGKGRSLIHAAQSRGLAPHQIIGIGDTLNDLDMLDGRFGIRGAAVGNADPAVKAAVAKTQGIIAEGTASEGLHEILLTYRQQGLLR